MPRSRQAYPNNAVVNHNPMQRMRFDPTNIAKMGPSVMQVPDITQVVEDMLAGWTNLIIEVPALFEDVINAVLGAIDDATGLNLVDVNSLLNDILTWIDNAGAALQQDWLNFQQLINGITGRVDAGVSDLITELNAGGVAFTTLITSLWTDVQNYTTWSSFLAAVESAWDTYITTVTSLTSAEIITIEQILDTLLGIDPATGKFVGWLPLLSLLFPSSGGTVGSSVTPNAVGNVLGGANLGADVSSVSTTANNGADWATKLTNDLLITMDIFHLVYAAGTPADTPTTIWSGGGIGNGKRTWYSAWNDLLILVGIVNSVTPPTDTAPALAASIGTAQSTGQNLADAGHQAVYGGTATGTATDVTTLKTALTTQPAANIVPPPNPLSAGGVLRGASSSGSSNTASSGHSVTTTVSLTPATTDNYVIVPVYYIAGGMPAGATVYPSATVIYGTQGGGANLHLSSLAGPQPIGSSVFVNSDMYCDVLGGFITPGVAGAQTISITADVSAPAGYGRMVGGYASSFTGVQSIGAVNAFGDTTGTPTATASSSADNYDVISFVDTGTSSVALSALTGATARYTSGAVFSSAANEYMTMISGDQTGAASMTFGATTSNGFGTWYGLQVELVGASATPIGSVFNAVQTSTSAISIATADVWTTFPGSTWPTTAGWPNTTDYTYDLSTNTVTVLNAGTYMVSLGMLTYSLLSNQNVGLGISKNGIRYRCGPVSEVTNQTTLAQIAYAFSVPVYCNANDTITPICISTLALTIWQGEATGSQSYFSIGLMNRSLL